MKLWHKDLIIYLPEVQLIEQWEDCYHILEVLLDKGTLEGSFSKVLNYSFTQFASYTYNEWTLTRPDRIDGWEKLTAKEIIEHDDFTDRRCFANVATVHGYSLETELFMLLSGYYDPEEPFGINPKTSGIVAVIYREPIYTEKEELL